jgi:hypothetical protein
VHHAHRLRGYAIYGVPAVSGRDQHIDRVTDTDASGDRAKTNKLDDLLKAGRLQRRLQPVMQRKLESAGYTVSIETVDRKSPWRWRRMRVALQVRSSTPDLARWVCQWSITDQDFRPAIKVDVQVTSKGRTLYSQALMYGYHNPFMKGTDLAAPKDYYFDGYDKLVSDPAKLRKGLDLGIDAIAMHVVTRLTGTARVTKAQ